MLFKVKMELNEKEISIKIDSGNLKGILAIPQNCLGLIIFAHGSGSSRLSRRNSFVAGELQKGGFGTLLMDLLTEKEELDRQNVFDINLLSDRLLSAKKWVMNQYKTQHLKIGYFGASTGAAAAMVAAAKEPENVFAIVSRGGRVDMAGSYLIEVSAPTLLIVGGEDDIVIDLNQASFEKLNCSKEIRIIPGATHLFEEPGALELVSEMATEWFTKYSGLSNVHNSPSKEHVSSRDHR
jgi:putative phosphoribosyl transferase